MARTVDSFYTTIWICTDQGLGHIEGCCLDSGYEGCNYQGNINPNVVRTLGLPTYPVNVRYTLGDGSRGRHRFAVSVPLTFHTIEFTITLTVDLVVNNVDASSYNVLLGTDVLHRLGGVHDHRSNPSTFQVTHPETGNHGVLGVNTKHQREVNWAYKSDRYHYLRNLTYCPAFAHSGHAALPKIAINHIGSSNELFYFLMRIWREETVFGVDIRENCERLIEAIAWEERQQFALGALALEPVPVGLTALDIYSEMDALRDRQLHEQRNDYSDEAMDGYGEDEEYEEGGDFDDEGGYY